MSEIKKSIVAKVLYTTTDSTLIGYLPAGAFIEGINVSIETAFNAGGNDYLQIGTSTDEDAFGDDINVGTKDIVLVDVPSAGIGILSTTVPTGIYVDYQPAGSAPTAGVAYVVITYVQPIAQTTGF